MTYRTQDAPIDGLRTGRMVSNDEAAKMMVKTAETLVARARDAQLTTNFRLTAGPAASAPDQGTLYDGNGPRRVPGSSAEELRRNLRLANPDLTDEEIEDLVGVTMEPIGKLGGARPTSDVQSYRRMRAADATEIQRVQDLNDALYNPDALLRRKEIDRALAGR